MAKKSGADKTEEKGGGGPMWSTAKVSEDDESLDGYLSSPRPAKHLPPPPSASPFSQLFPLRLLSDSGVDLDDNEAETRREAAWATAQLKPKQPNGQKTHFCQQCAAGFTRRYSLNKHVHDKHAALSAPMRHCPLSGCTFVTRNVNAMQLHKRNHQQRPMQYFCKQCRCRYSQRQALLHHITNQHGSNAALFGMGVPADVPNKTDVVVEEDTNAAVTTVIIKQEEKMKKTRSTSLANRLDFALTTTPSTDQQTAAKTTTRSSSKQQTSPPKKAKYACDRCPFSAPTFRQLFTHRQRDHPSKVTCVYCRKQFTSPDRLASHMKANHLTNAKRYIDSASAKRYSCDRCDFQTTTKRVFSAHRTMHQVEGTVTRTAPVVEPVRSEAPTASVAPYVKATHRSPCPLTPTIPHELETAMAGLNQVNTSLVQLVKRKDLEMRDLRMNVARLLQLLLPSSHPLQPALVSNLIAGPQIDHAVATIVSNQSAGT